MPSETESLAFSPDSKYIAVGNTDFVAQIWEISSGQPVHEFSGHKGLVQGIKFLPDGRFLLTGSGDKTARLWDIVTGQTLRVFTGHGIAVQSVAFFPDGTLVATASNDGIARPSNLGSINGQGHYGLEGPHRSRLWSCFFHRMANIFSLPALMALRGCG